MRKDVVAFCICPVDNSANFFQLRPGDQRAVQVVDIAGQFSSRRPVEQDRYAFEPAIFDKLRKPEKRIARRVVVTVNKEQDVPIAPRKTRQLRVD